MSATITQLPLGLHGVHKDNFHINLQSTSEVPKYFPTFQYKYRGADKSLARPRRKQATATEDFDVHISYL